MNVSGAKTPFLHSKADWTAGAGRTWSGSLSSLRIKPLACSRFHPKRLTIVPHGCPVIQTHKGLVTAFSHGRVAAGESEPQGEAEAGGGGARHPYLSVKSHSLLVGMREESSRGPRISRTRDGLLVVRKSTPISIMRRMSSSRLTTQALTDIPQRWASSTHSGCL